MRQNRKETSWKKNRKFGDIKGGRKWPKIADNVFNRAHNFNKPLEGEKTPIYIQDNPSKDFYFPVTIDEINFFLNKLPKEHIDNITHIWLRKVSKKEFEAEKIQGCFICGSGVNLIVLYPFPVSMKMSFGKKKPLKKDIRWYSRFNPELIFENNEWYLMWTEENIKKYYLEGLLLHEIGHKVDSLYQRYWTKAYRKRAEKFADNFSYYWSRNLEVLENSNN